MRPRSHVVDEPQVVQVTPFENQQGIHDLLSVYSPQKIAITNLILKRTVKSLRKKLSRARLAFGRIMSETREQPEWFYESEMESLSDAEIIRTAQAGMADMSAAGNKRAKGMWGVNKRLRINDNDKNLLIDWWESKTIFKSGRLTIHSTVMGPCMMNKIMFHSKLLLTN